MLPDKHPYPILLQGCQGLIDAVDELVDVLKVFGHLGGQDHVNDGLPECAVLVSEQSREGQHRMGSDVMSLLCIVVPSPMNGQHCSGFPPQRGWLHVKGTALGLKSHLNKTPVKDMQQQTGPACRHKLLASPLSHVCMLRRVVMRVGHYYENKAVH